MAYTAPFDASGALIGSDVEGSFDGALALSAKLAESRQVSNCFGTRVWVSAFGRKPIAGEEASLAYVQGRLAQTGSLKEAVIAIIESPGFRYLKKATP